MKKHLLTAVCLCFAASPALALEVTNLDHVDHRVLFESAGHQEVRVVAAGETEYFLGQPNGFLSLSDAKHPKKAKGVVQSDGMLSGIIGNGRTEGIPADTDDVFVIWQDGHIALQQRRQYAHDFR